MCAHVYVYNMSSLNARPVIVDGQWEHNEYQHMKTEFQTLYQHMKTEEVPTLYDTNNSKANVITRLNNCLYVFITHKLDHS